MPQGYLGWWSLTTALAMPCLSAADPSGIKVKLLEASTPSSPKAATSSSSKACLFTRLLVSAVARSFLYGLAGFSGLDQEPLILVLGAQEARANTRVRLARKEYYFHKEFYLWLRSNCLKIWSTAFRTDLSLSSWFLGTTSEIVPIHTGTFPEVLTKCTVRLPSR